MIRIKGRFFNYSLTNIHAPTNDSEEEAQDQFYEQLEWAYAACPEVGDGRRERNNRQAQHSLHESTNEMASDWSTSLQAGEWRSKVRTSCTNESTSQPGTP
jgi:hypothetical protein